MKETQNTVVEQNQSDNMDEIKPAAICSQWFIDPDGDLLTRPPVQAIWIDTSYVGIFRRQCKYKVRLQFENSSEWEWTYTRDTLAEAEVVRDKLIAALCMDK